MSRYADIEPIIRKIKYSMEIGEIRGRIWFEMVLKDLEELPEVDAVPVVRCKDCKHWLKTTATYVEGDPVYTCPKLTMDWGDEDGYCFMGERR